MISNFGMGNKSEVFFNDDSIPYSEYTKNIIDKESLDLVKEAYETAKDILEKNKWKLIYFSELLQNNTVIYNRDINEKFIFTF